MLKYVSSLFLMIVAVACGPRYVDYFPYHDNGCPKPRVALMPVIDSSQSGLPWSISEELSQSIYYSLMDSGELYVLTPKEVGPGWQKKDTIDFFGTDTSFTNDFCNADFIVAMELIEHSTAPCDAVDITGRSFPGCHPIGNVLTLRMRVKILDIRGDKPRVALYEIVKSGYTIKPSCYNVDYSQSGWGTVEFSTTPCAVVHRRMVQNISTRIEQAIRSSH